MKAYQPNFNDPRIIKAVERALTFVEQYTKASQKKWISSRELYKHFGNTSRQPGKYLKEQLLIVADPYYNPETGVCKKYVRNDLAIQEIRTACGLVGVLPSLTADLEQQLDTGEFKYTEKSDRLYNPLQFIPKQVRGSLLANRGYRYHYDIEAAAPTLLIQKARKLNPSLDIPYLEYYTQNRSQVRQAISMDCNISPSQVKFVINAILQGGVISRWQGNKIYQELNYNSDTIIRLQNNLLVRDIKKDISLMWKSLKTEFSERMITDKNGKIRRKSLSGRDKSSLYRELETQVGKSIRKILKKNRIQSLWIHDGWCCDRFIDPIYVQTEVRRTTGYSVKLEWNIYEEL